MNKEFIPYQEALALKGLEFDEPCLGYWYTTNGKNPLIRSELSLDGWTNHPDSNTVAPLYQQAFRWFREKHGLCAYVSPDEGIYKMHDKSFGYTIDTDSYNYGYNYGFTSYEKAEFACLQKLIEITKSRQLMKK